MKLRNRQNLKHLFKNTIKISQPPLSNDELVETYYLRSKDFFDKFHENYRVFEMKSPKKEKYLISKVTKK